MKCPFCGATRQEGTLAVYESLGGKLTRLSVYPFFVGGSWRKLAFVAPQDPTDDSYLPMPLSRSGDFRGGHRCAARGAVVVRGDLAA